MTSEAVLGTPFLMDSDFDTGQLVGSRETVADSQASTLAETLVAAEALLNADPAVSSAVDLDHSYGSFEAISLEQLVQRAGLLTRTDRKYLMPVSKVGPLLDELRGLAAVLDIGGLRNFDYHSVYFDTPDLLTYWLAARGRRLRFKLRTRTYVDSNQAYLEIKTKGPRGNTVKNRIEYDPANARHLTAEGHEFVAAMLAEARIPGVDTHTLTPALTSRYRRSTLFIPSTESRTTIDTSLQWALEDGRTLHRPSMAMIETKSGSRASEVDRLLWSHGYRPLRVSKYATGMAALRPDLVANRWGRVLKRDFDRQRSGRAFMD
jgi:hypothetical protein